MALEAASCTSPSGQARETLQRCMEVQQHSRDSPGIDLHAVELGLALGDSPPPAHLVDCEAQEGASAADSSGQRQGKKELAGSSGAGGEAAAGKISEAHAAPGVESQVASFGEAPKAVLPRGHTSVSADGSDRTSSVTTLLVRMDCSGSDDEVHLDSQVHLPIDLARKRPCGTVPGSAGLGGSSLSPSVPSNPQIEVARQFYTFAPPSPRRVTDFLEGYGYRALSAAEWHAPSSCEGSPCLRLIVEGHLEADGHTWYLILGTLEWGAHCSRWRVRRRLSQLRECLHEGVRRELGAAYERLFEGSTFARRGGLPGTTARLHAWCVVLAEAINTGCAPPALVALTLEFLHAPTWAWSPLTESLRHRPAWLDLGRDGTGI